MTTKVRESAMLSNVGLILYGSMFVITSLFCIGILRQIEKRLGLE